MLNFISKIFSVWSGRRMEHNEQDRRVRRTRKRLQEALAALMREKELKDITVRELTDLADVNRGTF